MTSLLHRVILFFSLCASAIAHADTADLIISEYPLGQAHTVLSETPLGADFIQGRISPIAKVRPAHWNTRKQPRGDSETQNPSDDLLASIRSGLTLKLLSTTRADDTLESKLAVVKQGAILFEINCTGPISSSAFQAFFSFGKDWILECFDQVVVNGKRLTDTYSVDKVFEYRYLDGQPFFFYEKKNRVGIQYAGKKYEQNYDKVIHSLCCEPGMTNPQHYQHFTSFIALRDNSLFYVEAGIDASGNTDL